MSNKDVFGAIASLEEAREAKRKKKSGEPPTRKEDDKRPTIRLAPGEARTRVADESEAALLAAGVELYKQGSRIVRVRWDEITVPGGEKGKVLRLGDVAVDALLEMFEKHAVYEKFDVRADEWLVANCPKETAAAYVARDGAWKLRFVLAVVNTPTMRPDGSILSAPGYDASTSLIFDPLGVEFPAIPESPTKEDALRALDELKRPLAHFPFVHPAGRSVALASFLTAVLRRSMEAAPLFAYDAPLAGAGKTKLSNMAAILVTGERAAVVNTGKDKYGDAELEKRLAASLYAGYPVILIDNVDGQLGTEMLNSMLTEPRIRIRVLGSTTKSPEIVNTSLCMANGNNIVILGDMTRRVLLARLDPKVERPELVQFEFEPVAYVKERRAALVAAILTIARWYKLSGDPGDGVKLGSFEQWTRMVRDPLVALGEPDPLDVMEEVRKGDPRLMKIKAVMSAWAATFGDDGRTLPQAIAVAQDRDGEGGRYLNPDLRDALLAVTAGGEQAPINPEKLGWWLRKNADRYVDGLRFVRADDGAKVAVWKLEGAASILPARGLGGDDIPF